jgi:hypothetical protein
MNHSGKKSKKRLLTTKTNKIMDIDEILERHNKAFNLQNVILKTNAKVLLIVLTPKYRSA